MKVTSFESRLLGGLHGSLVGDALGVPVEFQSRQARRSDPVTSMRAFGTWNQPAGTWSDDGSLLLCSVESLAKTGFDPEDMGERFVRWLQTGYWAAHGRVFDIGNATRQALDRIRSGTPAIEAGGRRETDNGNGSLMRILPVSLYAHPHDTAVARDQLHQASAITHGHARSLMACEFHGLIVRELLAGSTPMAAMKAAQAAFAASNAHSPELPAFAALLQPDFAATPEQKIKSGGYVMHTLEAALWCLLNTGSFAECVLSAVNLGEDTDTTGCVAGGLAGVLHGIESIPQDWLDALPRQDDLRELFDRFIKTAANQPRSSTRL